MSRDRWGAWEKVLDHHPPRREIGVSLRWTTEQETVLEETAPLGLEACRDELIEQCGVVRSTAAIQRHGSRIGLSFRRYERCERCGALFRYGYLRNGICETCRTKEFEARAKERAAYAKELAETAERNQAIDTEGYRKHRRAYDSYRSQLRRAKATLKRHGISTDGI
ncbi:MAG: hypothetical protein ACOX69_02935 [Coriobacteriales bacterium]